MNNLDRNKSAVRPAGKKSFRLDRANGKIAGVCGGIANYFGMDALIVRLVFVAGFLLGFGTFGLVYLAIWLLAD
ncbi:PspC domain-containing protein [Aurantiacibacter gangjinensis]|uniref:Uncharacterized protein n=1 Tax=Aurantiacibacter gangjinensis TaxID=502682 RepID=A0A0G9MRP6_9SPHN|nr:PspC domain-containing protein [Aurantiacibacter gangjinensis]APE26954.1 Putative stress-responsive transcriptional regulator [Aurantiacibacter gangjinensis]KLE33407.1 hypothetical protein AAW01_05630 [Aurantiacibacter gangjinensis]